MQPRIEHFQSSVSRLSRFEDLVVILGAAVVGTWIAYWLGENLPDVGDLISSGTWRVLAITTFGLLLSFTRFRNYEGAGASKMGSLALYLLITAIVYPGLPVGMPFLFQAVTLRWGSTFEISTPSVSVVR